VTGEKRKLWERSKQMVSGGCIWPGAGELVMREELLRVQGRRRRAEMAGGPWLCSGRATTKDPRGQRLFFQKKIKLLGGCGSFGFKRENDG
jgi:hypothetical protein